MCIRDRHDARTLDDPGRSNLQYFPQIHQALAGEDHEFLISRGGAKLARLVAGERRDVALQFLAALQEEFDRLMRLARVIAALSPEVQPVQEFERLRLTVILHCRVQAIRARLAFGARPLPEMNAVSTLVSRLAVRMEAAMKELGERAALAAELASAADRGDVDVA